MKPTDWYIVDRSRARIVREALQWNGVFRARKRQYFKRVILIILLCIGSAKANVVSEFDLKAAYLYKMIKFIDWPDAVFNSPNDSLRICVVGSSPLIKKIFLLDQQLVKNRKLWVVQLDSNADLTKCQVLYIAFRGNKKKLQIIKQVLGYPVVTVSSGSAFVDLGGMIGLVKKANRVGIEINVDAAKKESVLIRAQLIEVAKRVIKVKVSN